MNRNKSGHAFDLLHLSFTYRVGVQLAIFLSLVVVPYINPDLVLLGNPLVVALNVVFTLFLNIVFEVLKIFLKNREKEHELLINVQVITNSLLLSWFLHVIGRINGPFFVVLLVFVLESAFSATRLVQNIVFGILFFATFLEFFWTGLAGYSQFDFLSFVFLAVRLISLILVKSYATILFERLELEERTAQSLTNMNQKLKDIDKNKDEFIYMAAHEMRTPVTAIKGYVSMILEGDAGEIPPKVRGFLADVNNINDRLIRLLNNMLNVSKIEEGKLVYQMDKENLSRLVRGVFSQFIPETERKGLAYTLSIPRSIRDKVYVDPDRVQEVIGNLISNAVKYTDEGTVIVRLKRSATNRVRFEVEDTGTGISEEEQKKLFQKFHRVETNVGKTTGSGLGLYISKLIIEKFSGKIGVSSKLGRGSVFWFDLPLTT